MTKVKHLVVDSGAFIKNAPVHECAENVYTVSGAIKEIKDKATRQRLQFLPYDLKVKEPSPDAYKYVLEFSKKTGDFSNLSVVDLQIIALTYQLEKENVGTNHLNTELTYKVTNKPCFSDTQLSGFYYPKQENNNFELESSEELSADVKSVNDDYKKSEINESEVSNTNVTEYEDNIKHDKSKENKIPEDSHDDDEEEEDVESDSNDGWITSSNITEMQKKMGAIVLDEESDVCVACISTDFSIQNVLLQIGLHILSVNGLLIKNTRVFILRCYACYKTCNTSKEFCPNCGNKTLKRVAVSFNEEGSKNIHINFKKRINIRGTRYSLPMPKGGKHAVNPVLCEDQPIPHNRPAKMALQKIDVFSPDYEALSSPFAVNDVYSRAASLGIRSNKSKSQKKNMNDWSKRTGNKKGRK